MSKGDANHSRATLHPAFLRLDSRHFPLAEDNLPGRSPRCTEVPCMQPMHNIPARGGLNYDETPFLAIWEVTQSCDLACKHCRAAAQPIAHPEQLSTAEGKGLIDQIAAMGVPIFIFTGRRPAEAARPVRADPLRGGKERQDRGHAQRHAAADPRSDFQDEGGRRGPAGYLAGRLDALKFTICSADCRAPGRGRSRRWSGPARRAFRSRYIRRSAATTPTIWITSARCLKSWRSSCGMCSSWFRWDAGSWTTCSPARSSRQVFGKIYELSHRVSFQIKTTEAMHYRRYLLQHNLEERKMGHGTGHPHAAAVAEYEPGAPKADAQTRTHGLGHPARERRQGLHVHLAHGQCVSQRISAHPCRQHPRDAAGATFTAMRRSSRRCAIRAAWKASAARANTRRSAADRGRGPMR